MAEIRVTLQVPGDMTLEGTSIPAGMRTMEIIEEIVGQLELPRVYKAKNVKYSLLVVESNHLLAEDESLLSARVDEGAILRLIPTDDTGIDIAASLASANLSASRPLKPGRTLRIFLCHSSRDKQKVRALHKRLKSDGFDPWLDEDKILPGQDWNQQIISAVRNSDVVLVCLSQHSISKAGYVQKEIKYALDVADEQPEGAIFLIPVRLEACEVPQRLDRWQWLNYFEDQDYQRLLLALEVKATETSLRLSKDRKPTINSNVKTDGPHHSESERPSGLSKIYKNLANLTKRGRFINPERSESERVSALIKIYEDLIYLTECSKFIKCVESDIKPDHSHEKYIITFTCLGIAGIDRGGEPQYSEFHQVSMDLPDDYPSLGPVLKWLTPIWHPNVLHYPPHHVCSPPYDPHHEEWRTLPIGELVIALGEMVQYKRYHAELSPPFPCDLEVARWVLEYAEPRSIFNKDNPIDRRSLVQRYSS